MGNQNVIKMWTRGVEAKASNMRTNGKELFSYNLKIGYTDKRGNKIVLDYTTKSGNFKSKTTSNHVSSAKLVADIVENPV